MKRAGKRKQADPDRYRAQRREAAARWASTHRDEVNASNRKRYEAKRIEMTKNRRQQYWADPDTARRKRRESYAAHKGLFAVEGVVEGRRLVRG